MPNVIIRNVGGYDLTTRENKWIIEQYNNKEIVKEISPNHLLKKSATKMLLIHGEKDRNCPYDTAIIFYEDMKFLGNDIQLHSLPKTTRHNRESTPSAR